MPVLNLRIFIALRFFWVMAFFYLKIEDFNFLAICKELELVSLSPDGYFSYSAPLSAIILTQSM